MIRMMRFLSERRTVVVALGLVALVSYEWSALAPKANAIPAFARKYNFACNVCHVPGFPKLNDFGNVFRDHGFQLGSDNDLPEFEGIQMGYWPVSLRSTVGYRTITYSQNGAVSGPQAGGDVTTGSFGFKTLNLLSYGILAKNVSFGLIYNPALQSANFQTGASQGDLPNAFVRLNNLERFVGGGTQNSYLLNVKVGKYEPELPFSAFRNPTQLNTPIVIYNYQAGSAYASANFPNNNRVNATAYSNNTLSSLQRGQPGIEVAGIKETKATHGYFRYSLNAFSNSQAVGNQGGRGYYFYGHATQSFDGYGIVSGHRVGMSGWFGDAPTQTNSLTTSQGTATGGQKFYRFSVDASTTYDGQVNLFGAYIHANDSSELMPTTGANATPIQNRQDAIWNGGFVELDWYPPQLFGTTGWLFLYRYDLVRNEQQGNRAVRGDYGNVDSHVWMSRYFFHFSSRTDIAWHTEYNWFSTRATGNNGQDTIGQMFFTGFDFAL
jgi:hypothetical protein